METDRRIPLGKRLNMLDLESAIKHCEEKVKELREQPFKEKMDIEDIADCEECAEEHEQLAEWLKDYKRLLERSQGDIISREALRKAVNAFFDEHFKGLVPTELIEYAEAVDDFINNAPTVEPKTKLVANVTFDKEQMEELVEKAKADILEQIERPQGEWRVYEGVITCEKCGEETEEMTPFCAWCGADMRGK